MKLTVRVLKILFSVLLLILAAAFGVIEGRLLVSGDWLLHEVPFLAFLCYFKPHIQQCHQGCGR